MGVTFPFLEGVAPATPRRVESARQAGSTSSLQAGRLNLVVQSRPPFGSRAARDTCAPRALVRGLINRNVFTIQGLQFCLARGARGSRDTSAAQRLSIDFSNLPSIGRSRLPQ